MISFSAKTSDGAASRAAENPGKGQDTNPFSALRGAFSTSTDLEAARTITEENRKNIRVYSLMMIVTFLLCIIASFFVGVMEASRPVYIGCEIMGIVLFATSFKRTKRTDYVVPVIVLVVSFVMMAFGIMLGTITSPDTPTVAFNVLLFAVPLLFTYDPRLVVALIGVSVVAYVAIAFNTQTASMLEFNLVNVGIYSVLGIGLGVYTMHLKIERAVALEEIRRLSERDPLTGLLNRRSYMHELAELDEANVTSNVTVIVVDLNGLKSVNDRFGHAAGDALITAAANCLNDVFCEWGNVYRTGGDEFAVVVKEKCLDDDELREQIIARADLWTGQPEEGLSMSIGFAHGNDCETMTELVRVADARMYADKAQHYRETGFDRRK